MLSLNLPDGSELANDPNDLRFHQEPKRLDEMSEDEMFCAITENEDTGLPSPWVFKQEEKLRGWIYSGYIELEGVKPFERSSKLKANQSAEQAKLRGNDGPKKTMILSAVGIILRPLLAQQDYTNIYHSGGVLFRFRSANMKDVHAFVEKANTELRAVTAKIKRPDQVIVQRIADLRFVLSEVKVKSTEIYETGAVLASGLKGVMEREGASLGATIMHLSSEGRTIGIGHESATSSADMDELLRIGFRPIGVFVLRLVDSKSFKVRTFTHKSVPERDELRMRELIYQCVKSLFPDVPLEKIVEK